MSLPSEHKAKLLAADNFSLKQRVKTSKLVNFTLKVKGKNIAHSVYNTCPQITTVYVYRKIRSEKNRASNRINQNLQCLGGGFLN